MKEVSVRTKLLALALFASFIPLEARAMDKVPQGKWYVASRDVTVALKPCEADAGRAPRKCSISG
jgi:hypothetical protein